MGELIVKSHEKGQTKSGEQLDARSKRFEQEERECLECQIRQYWLIVKEAGKVAELVVKVEPRMWTWLKCGARCETGDLNLKSTTF